MSDLLVYNQNNSKNECLEERRGLYDIHQAGSNRKRYS